MTKEERKDFQDMVQTGKIQSLIPEFKPFWTKMDQDGDLEHICPRIEENIPKMSSSPNPRVKFNLLNVLYAYCYSLRFYYGNCETENILQFASLVFAISHNLSQNTNFDSADQALDMARAQVDLHPEYSVSPQMTKDVKKDVYLMVKGPDHRLWHNKDYYILAGLSQLKRILAKVVKKLKKEDEKVLKDSVDRDLVKRSAKKIEFYLSWAKEFGRCEFDLIR